MADAKKADKNTKDQQPGPEVKQVEIEGYKFKVDTDLLDDVETFEIIDLIENKGQTAQIVPLLRHILGDEQYEEIKAHFTKLDAEAHKGVKNYKPRFRLEKLNDVYLAIIDEFDPKG